MTMDTAREDSPLPGRRGRRTDPGMAFEIVVGIDYSDLGGLALSKALEMLSSRPEARIHAIAVAQESNTPTGGPRLPTELKADAKQSFLDEARETLERYLNSRVDAMDVDRERILDAVDFGEPAERILALAHSVEADLVIVGTHGRRGMERLMLGSVAETVLRNAHCPVLVVREKKHAAAE